MLLPPRIERLVIDVQVKPIAVCIDFGIKRNSMLACIKSLTVKGWRHGRSVQTNALWLRLPINSGNDLGGLRYLLPPVGLVERRRVSYSTATFSRKRLENQRFLQSGTCFVECRARLSVKTTCTTGTVMATAAPSSTASRSRAAQGAGDRVAGHRRQMVDALPLSVAAEPDQGVTAKFEEVG